MFRRHRRDFLKRAAAAGLSATFAISGTKASGRVLGANDRVRDAVAGINGRGQQHITAYGEMRDVEVAWLVDPDGRLFASRSAAVQKLAGNSPQCIQDFRRALDDETLDAPVTITPVKPGRCRANTISRWRHPKSMPASSTRVSAIYCVTFPPAATAICW